MEDGHSTVESMPSFGFRRAGDDKERRSTPIARLLIRMGARQARSRTLVALVALCVFTTWIVSLRCVLRIGLGARSGQPLIRSDTGAAEAMSVGLGVLLTLHPGCVDPEGGRLTATARQAGCSWARCERWGWGCPRSDPVKSYHRPACWRHTCASVQKKTTGTTGMQVVCSDQRDERASATCSRPTYSLWMQPPARCFAPPSPGELTGVKEPIG